MRFNRVFVLLVALMMVAGALAQGSAPARPQGGRQGGGMRMGGMGGGMLMIPELQKELKVTAAQKASIDKIVKEMQAVPRDKMNREAAQKYMTRINNVLSATQKARLKQIELQMQGGSALLNPEVQKSLGITAAQKTKLTSLRETSQKDMRAKMEAARKANKPLDPAAMQKLRKAQDAKFLAVLSASQKAKWNTMIGKPFAMPAMRARRSGQ